MHTKYISMSLFETKKQLLKHSETAGFINELLLNYTNL